MLREVLAVRVLGTEHPDTLTTANDLASRAPLRPAPAARGAPPCAGAARRGCPGSRARAASAQTDAAAPAARARPRGRPSRGRGARARRAGRGCRRRPRRRAAAPAARARQAAAGRRGHCPRRAATHRRPRRAPPRPRPPPCAVRASRRRPLRSEPPPRACHGLAPPACMWAAPCYSRRKKQKGKKKSSWRKFFRSECALSTFGCVLQDSENFHSVADPPCGVPICRAFAKFLTQAFRRVPALGTKSPSRSRSGHRGKGRQERKQARRAAAAGAGVAALTSATPSPVPDPRGAAIAAPRTAARAPHKPPCQSWTAAAGWARAGGGGSGRSGGARGRERVNLQGHRRGTAARRGAAWGRARPRPRAPARPRRSNALDQVTAA